jgi:hypothetical protein
MKLGKLNILLAIAIFIGCKPERKYVSITGQAVYTDTIQHRQAPSFDNSDEFYDSIFFLYPISADSSKLEIRIFRSYGLHNKDFDESLFVIKQDINNEWSKFASVMKIEEPNVSERMAKYIPRNVSLPIKVSDLKAVADTLLSLGVLEPGDYRNIENYDISTDSDDVIVEYVYEGETRRYQLFEPSGNRQNEDAKAMWKVLSYIELKCGFNGFAK